MLWYNSKVALIFMNLILEPEFLLQEMALLSESLVLLEYPAYCVLYYTIFI